MAKRTYTCLLCKNKIENGLIEVEHISKKGNKSIKRYHKICLENSVTKQKHKDEFYKYIEDHFFPIAIPNLLFVEMSYIKCSYNDILACCKSIDLVNIISQATFYNDVSKVKYMVSVIRGNINTYMNNKYSDKTYEDNIDMNDFI